MNYEYTAVNYHFSADIESAWLTLRLHFDELDHEHGFAWTKLRTPNIDLGIESRVDL